jgi:acyl-CoA thioester hydrolase
MATAADPGADPVADAAAGRPHVYPLRVYYEDTDAGGMVYHANYLRFAERARTEMLRDLGTGQQGLAEDTGLRLTVRRCLVDYRRPARLDDALEVHTRLRRLGGASAAAEQIVMRDGDAIVRLDVEVACIDDAGRPRRWPAPLRAALQPLVQPR